jgi:hypothetical protein
MVWCDDPTEDRVISIFAGCLAHHDRAHSPWGLDSHLSRFLSLLLGRQRRTVECYKFSPFCTDGNLLYLFFSIKKTFFFNFFSTLSKCRFLYKCVRYYVLSPFCWKDCFFVCCSQPECLQPECLFQKDTFRSPISSRVNSCELPTLSKLAIAPDRLLTSFNCLTAFFVKPSHLHLVCARLRHPPALALSLSPHRQPFSISPPSPRFIRYNGVGKGPTIQLNS